MGIKFNPFTSKLDIINGPSGEFSDIELALGTQTDPSLSFIGDSNTGIYSPGADQLAISTGGTGRLFVDSSGRVGIGTASPQYLVHAASAVSGGGDVGYRVQDTTNSKIVQLMRTGSSYSYIGIGATEGVVYSQDTLTLATDNSSPIKFAAGGGEAARIDSSGRLLVGTSTARTLFTGFTPTVQVETATSATANISIVSTQNTAGGANFWLGHARGANGVLDSDDELGALLFNGGDGTDIQSIGVKIAAEVDGTPGADDMPGRLVFSTTADGAASPTERMRIDSSGRVGIGTNSVSHQLDVVSTSTAVAEFFGPANASVEFKGSGFVEGKIQCGGEFIIGSTNNYPVAFVTNGTERVRIDSSGNLLVGTSAVTMPAKITALNSLSLGYGSLSIAKETSGTTTQTILSITIPAAAAFMLIEATYIGSRQPLNAGGTSQVSKERYAIARQGSGSDVVIDSDVNSQNFEVATTTAGGAINKDTMSPGIARAGAEANTSPQQVDITINPAAGGGGTGYVRAFFNIIYQGTKANLSIT